MTNTKSLLQALNEVSKYTPKLDLATASDLQLWVDYQECHKEQNEIDCQTLDTNISIIKSLIVYLKSNETSVDDDDQLYTVALQIGGIMEDPEIRYTNHQDILAKSPDEAERIYNKRNNCEYFYGKCIN